MKAKSEVKFDQIAFEKMKRIVPNLLTAQREQETGDYSVRKLPEEIAFKLTNRCNLRCKHCYQWNEDGHHKNLDKIEQNRDLDFSIIEKVFAQTQEIKSNVYLWGGEPLVYKDWNKLVDLLEKDPRWTSICTNGIGIEKNLSSILRISEHFEILVAIEGFKDEHDFIRGKGNYEKAIEALDLLLEEKKVGNYKGEIAVNFVITDKMVSRVYEILEFFEKKGIDTVYLSLLWYLSDETTAKMDKYFASYLDWLCHGEDTIPSWHAYKFRLNSDSVDRLTDELKKVNERIWKLAFRLKQLNSQEKKGV